MTLTKPLYVSFSPLESKFKSRHGHHLPSQVAEDSEVTRKADLNTGQMQG